MIRHALRLRLISGLLVGTLPLSLAAIAEPPLLSLPDKISHDGALVPADLAVWNAEDPADYAGHYVCASVTDGWIDLELTVTKEADANWFIQTMWRDTREDDLRDGLDLPRTPLNLDRLPRFQPERSPTPLFFVLDKRRDQTMPARSVVSNDGSIYVREPAMPRKVMIGDKMVHAEISPWRATDQSQYAGTYRSLNEAKGRRVLEISITFYPERRLPYLIDSVCRIQGMGKDDDVIEYTESPLWTSRLPHFNAHSTYIFVHFKDPTGHTAAPARAVITESGDVLVKTK
jgi:hypothetical protein